MDESVSVKQVILFLPQNAKMPIGYEEWTPEDTETVLSVGSVAFL